jgi:hypothetical protein
MTKTIVLWRIIRFEIRTGYTVGDWRIRGQVVADFNFAIGNPCVPHQCQKVCWQSEKGSHNTNDTKI